MATTPHGFSATEFTAIAARNGWLSLAPCITFYDTEPIIPFCASVHVSCKQLSPTNVLYIPDSHFPELTRKKRPSMARPQKRQRPDSLSRDHPSPKRIKHHPLSYPPEFWDRLSKQWLTHRALRELDRRNNTTEPNYPTVTAGGHCDIPRFVKEAGRDLARFARQGGPNLFDLRGVSLRRRRHS